MKISLACALLAFGLFGLPAHGGAPVTLAQSQIEQLTPVDANPTTGQIARALEPGDALPQLVGIASSTDGTFDIGVQLRAIRALPAYCPEGQPCGVGTPVHDTLAAIVDRFHNEAGHDTTAVDTLRLRAAIEALGLAGRSAGLDADVTRLVFQLDHRSRDIRAATAKALGVLCNTNAIQALQVRQGIEMSSTIGRAQVRLAISGALRDLDPVGGICAP